MRPTLARIAKAITEGDRRMTRALLSSRKRGFGFAAIVFAGALLVLFGSGAPTQAHADDMAINNSVLLNPFDPVPEIRFSRYGCDDDCGYRHCYHSCGEVRRCWHDCEGWRCEHECSERPPCWHDCRVGYRCEHDCEYDRDHCWHDCHIGWHCEHDCGHHDADHHDDGHPDDGDHHDDGHHDAGHP